jgi:hypothetical protein
LLFILTHNNSMKTKKKKTVSKMATSHLNTDVELIAGMPCLLYMRNVKLSNIIEDMGFLYKR